MALKKIGNILNIDTPYIPGDFDFICGVSVPLHHHESENCFKMPRPVGGLIHSACRGEKADF